MDLRLDGKRVMVTGSSRGIGRAISTMFAREGCSVLVHGRDRPALEQAVEDLRSLGVAADAVVGDLAHHEGLLAVEQRAATWGTEILVNNAGPFAEHTWENVDSSAWISAMDLNVLSAARIAQAVIPRMKDEHWGRIINIGSRAAVTALPNMVEYSAAKAAVVNMTISLARHLGGTGITANCVSPGVILSPGMREMFEKRAVSEGRDRSAWRDIAVAYAPNPSGRLGTSDDVARAVLFLSSPDSGYINGVNLKVDGGITGA